MTRADPSRRDDDGRRRLGQALRQARRRVGLRQSDLAARIGRHDSWISHVENGRRTPTTPMLLQLAEQLQALPEELLAAAGRIHPEMQAALLALTPDQAVRLRRALRERLQSS